MVEEEDAEKVLQRTGKEDPVGGEPASSNGESLLHPPMRMMPPPPPPPGFMPPHMMGDTSAPGTPPIAPPPGLAGPLETDVSGISNSSAGDAAQQELSQTLQQTPVEQEPIEPPNKQRPAKPSTPVKTPTQVSVEEIEKEMEGLRSTKAKKTKKEKAREKKEENEKKKREEAASSAPIIAPTPVAATSSSSAEVEPVVQAAASPTPAELMKMKRGDARKSFRLENSTTTTTPSATPSRIATPLKKETSKSPDLVSNEKSQENSAQTSRRTSVSSSNNDVNSAMLPAKREKHQEIDLHTGLPIVHELVPSVDSRDYVAQDFGAGLTKRQRKKMEQAQLKEISTQARLDQVPVFAQATKSRKTSQSSATGNEDDKVAVDDDHESESEGSDEDEEEEEVKAETASARKKREKDARTPAPKAATLAELQKAAAYNPSSAFRVPGSAPREATVKKVPDVRGKQKDVVPGLVQKPAKKKPVSQPTSVSKPSVAPVQLKNQNKQPASSVESSDVGQYRRSPPQSESRTSGVAAASNAQNQTAKVDENQAPNVAASGDKPGAVVGTKAGVSGAKVEPANRSVQPQSIVLDKRDLERSGGADRAAGGASAKATPAAKPAEPIGGAGAGAGTGGAKSNKGKQPDQEQKQQQQEQSGLNDVMKMFVDVMKDQTGPDFFSPKQSYVPTISPEELKKAVDSWPDVAPNLQVDYYGIHDEDDEGKNYTTAELDGLMKEFTNGKKVSMNCIEQMHQKSVADANAAEKRWAKFIQSNKAFFESLGDVKLVKKNKGKVSL